MSAREEAHKALISDVIDGGGDQAGIADYLWKRGYRRPRVVTRAAELNALPHGSVLLTSDYTDTALLKDGAIFRNQSGYEVTTEMLISYGSQPFTVLYEPEIQ